MAVTFQPQIEDMGRCTLYSEITNPIGVGNENVFIQAYVRIGKCLKQPFCEIFTNVFFLFLIYGPHEGSFFSTTSNILLHYSPK